MIRYFVALSILSIYALFDILEKNDYPGLIRPLGTVSDNRLRYASLFPSLQS